MQFASIIASRPSSSPTASARSRVPRRNRLLSGHMESASLQHFLPSSTHWRRTFSTSFLGAAAGATGAGGADVAQPPPVLPCCATGGAPQPVVGGGPQPPERGGARSRLLDRERSRRRRERGREREARAAGRDAYRHASCMLCGPCESLDVSHASHTLRHLSHRSRFAAQRSQMLQTSAEGTIVRGCAKVQSTGS